MLTPFWEHLANMLAAMSYVITNKATRENAPAPTASSSTQTSPEAPAPTASSGVQASPDAPAPTASSSTQTPPDAPVPTASSSVQTSTDAPAATASCSTQTSPGAPCTDVQARTATSAVQTAADLPTTATSAQTEPGSPVAHSFVQATANESSAAVQTGDDLEPAWSLPESDLVTFTIDLEADEVRRKRAASPVWTAEGDAEEIIGRGDCAVARRVFPGGASCDETDELELARAAPGRVQANSRWTRAGLQSFFFSRLGWCRELGERSRGEVFGSFEADRSPSISFGAAMCLTAEQACNAEEVQDLIYDPQMPTMPMEPRKFPAAPGTTRKYRVAASRHRLLSTISESAEVDFPDDVQVYARQTSAPPRVTFAVAEEIIQIEAKSSGAAGR
eukprot:s50_g34.t2